jgi:hypothetical protein
MNDKGTLWIKWLDVQKYERYNENDPTDIRDLLAHTDERMYIIKELKKKKQYLNPHDFIPGGIYVQKMPISL